MENCTIYSHYLEFDKVVQIVKSNLTNAFVEFNNNGLEKTLIATIKGGLFSKEKTLKINYRQRKNPSYKLEDIDCELSHNLAGMANFIQSLPAKNEDLRDKFLIKIKSTNCEMPFIAEPEITSEFKDVLQKIVAELDGFIFAQPGNLFNKSTAQYFTDKNLNLIIDTRGNCGITDLSVNIESKYYDQPEKEISNEQKERKVRSENYLLENKIKINKNLPCIPSSGEVKIRDIKEIIERAYSLLVIAVKGEGIEQEHLEKVVKDKEINGFSPKELSVYNTERLNDQERAYATWRYESLYVMLWALGKINDLKHPGEICDVPALVETIFKPTREEFVNSVSLRSNTEIIDELDKVYRMNWACVDAQISGQQVSGIEPGIIYERHYSLNWLTNYENQEWDDVQTDT